MPKEHPTVLTTSQAAKLCGVTPDAVLKWIHKGRLEAKRTAGGHFRIERRRLESLIPSLNKAKAAPSESPQAQMPARHCWEYMSDGGALRQECKRCVVYRLGVSECFLMADQEPATGRARPFRRNSCQNCGYYRQVKGLATKVLVVSPDADVLGHIDGEENESVLLQAVGNTYEASAIMEEFHPAFVVVDEQLLAGENGLIESLAADPRVPGLSIILLVGHSTSRKRNETEDRLIHSVIEKPISLHQISDAVDGFRGACPGPKTRTR